jgi:AcrR family transcriptional regulator
MTGNAGISEQDLINAGLEIARSDGLNNITISGLCEKAGISEDAFHSVYSSLDDLKTEVLVRVKSMVIAYTMNSYTENPFYNFGIGLVFFARDEQILFRTFFSEADTYSDIFERLADKLLHEMSKMSRFAQLTRAEQRELLMKVWCWSQGVADFVTMNLIPDDDETIKKVLYDTGHLIVQDTLDRAQKREENRDRQ